MRPLLLVAMAVAVTAGAPASTTRVFTPEDFGGDPTGGRDSTFAVQNCIDAALASSTSNSTVSTGVRRHEVDGTDYGGVLIDLNGGAF